MISIDAQGFNSSSLSAIFVSESLHSSSGRRLLQTSSDATNVSTSTTYDCSLNPELSCTLAYLPWGTYDVHAILQDGTHVIALGALQILFAVSGINPPLGSMGGGTSLTILGGG